MAGNVEFALFRKLALGCTCLRLSRTALASTETSFIFCTCLFNVSVLQMIRCVFDLLLCVLLPD